jgi:hypothetical protein
MSEIDLGPAAFFRGLRALMAQCGPNKNDQVIALISACLEDGVNTRRRIVGVGDTLGYKPQHVVTLLNEGVGIDPRRARWLRDGEGTYTLL